jgi:hypothetical protein
MKLREQSKDSVKQEKLGEDSEQSSQKPKKKRKDRRVEREYSDWVEVTDPVTGKKIKQKVKITRYKPKGDGFTKRTTITEEELGYDQTDESED